MNLIFKFERIKILGILFIMLSWSERINAMPAEFQPFIIMGKNVEVTALASSPEFQQPYTYFLRNYNLRTERGYLGENLNASTGYDALNPLIINFINYLNENYQQIRLNESEVSDTLYSLLGMSYALQAAKKNSINTSQIDFLFQKIHTSFCFSLGANEGIVNNLSRFLWNADCYESLNGGYDEAGLAVNNMYLTMMKTPSLKPQGINLATEFAYKAAIKDLKEANIFSFTASSYLESRKNLLNRVVILASDSKNRIVEYESLKILRNLNIATQDEKELMIVESKMLDILYKGKEINLFQYSYMISKNYFSKIIWIFLAFFPIVIFFFVSKKKSSFRLTLASFFHFLFGLETEIKSEYLIIMRTLWMFFLGIGISLFLNSMSPDVNQIILLK